MEARRGSTVEDRGRGDGQGQAMKGIGVDIVSVERINRAMKRTQGFEERAFTALERDYCLGKARPSEYFAARFAAKEAVMKALGKGLAGVGLQDIEIVSDGESRPEARLTGKALERLRQMGAKRVHLSISHEREFAVAFAVVE